ncbi:cytochrome b/b6 domain-containing protein [Brevibacterium sp. 50QC2O2]|uniref:cytochrome b/b6 domain-containing protein n=1 Tax=unclassified Brevibacterium TaxID=2614124 RepID=UPI00211D028A|nr:MULTISPECIES: cytochrome b/b6 domain-containing protein [unclassified Brevibacterium]MCQ9367749.1 cytochrome b/b6 domain-containing protein [Brevibacterium sp. 91QC2O2]MCQ9388008.1 cytochrome b/b6 domain-containing protein [Brevibacterium sp. 50QC2O2]
MAASTQKKKKKKSKGFDFQPFIKPGLYALGGIVVLAILVGLAIWLRTFDGVQAFIEKFPGQSAANEVRRGADGIPAWLSWQHFLNMFFMLTIIRTGLDVRNNPNPKGHWTRNNKGLIKTKGAPKKITLNLWTHFTMDFLWFLNGLVFFIMLFATGQWRRIVPASWDIFPNAISTALQYASMNWPTEMGWTNYNALQVLAYFVTVFIAAPVSLITGLRMSNAWKNEWAINKVFKVEYARALHFPTMIYFVAFICIHVFLVFVGALVAGLREGHGWFASLMGNVTHMYGGSPDVTATWFGFLMFAISIVVLVASWFLLRPMFLTPIANMFGKSSR